MHMKNKMPFVKDVKLGSLQLSSSSFSVPLFVIFFFLLPPQSSCLLTLTCVGILAPR